MADEIEDAKIKKELEKVDWGKIHKHGTVEVKLRDGKPTLATLKRTVKLD